MNGVWSVESEMAEDPRPLIPFLPDEISIRCIARVSVISHTALAQVSRSWRSLVRSSSFSSLRSELAVTELVLTVSIENESNGRHRWYHLHPYQTPFPLPPTQEQEHEHDFASVCASLGSRLFIIGGDHDPNSVQIYDGHLRRWSHGPPTSKPRMYDAAGVAGGRIHVLGRYSVFLSVLLAESLDPAGFRWDPVPPIPAHLFGDIPPIPAHLFGDDEWHNSDVLDGKLLVAWKREGELFGAAFDPDTAEWAHAPPWWVDDDIPLCSAVVRGVPYIFRKRKEGIVGYDNDGRWRPVESESVTELMSRMIKDEVRLLTFGDLLCLAGELKELRDGFVVRIFVGIDISRTANGGFKGSIVWLDDSMKYSEEECLDQCVVLEL